MQQRPDNSTLLMAMAQFLANEVRPAIEDKGLSFRVLIASAVATSMAIEGKGMHERESTELASVAALLDHDVAPELSVADRRKLAAELDAQLATALRDDVVDAEQFAAVGAHLEASLGARLAAMNPRFDLRDQVE